jgi:hypothetical protein
MKILFERTIEVDGVSANAAAPPVLTDSLDDLTATYGVKRLDTGAVVVPAGTPMVQAGLGRYTFELGDVTPGARYRFAYRVVVGDGQTVLDTFDQTATDDATVGGDAYLTVAEADTLAATLPALARWAAASADAKAKALRLATMEIDTAMPYQGARYAADQPLAFPRSPEPGRVWDLDRATGTAVVPLAVKFATLLQADYTLSPNRLDRLVKAHEGVVYDQTGALAESFKGGGTAGARSGLAYQAYQLMRQYALRTGVLL